MRAELTGRAQFGGAGPGAGQGSQPAAKRCERTQNELGCANRRANGAVEGSRATRRGRASSGSGGDRRAGLAGAGCVGRRTGGPGDIWAGGQLGRGGGAVGPGGAVGQVERWTGGVVGGRGCGEVASPRAWREAWRGGRGLVGRLEPGSRLLAPRDAGLIGFRRTAGGGPSRSSWRWRLERRAWADGDQVAGVGARRVGAR